MHNQWTGFFLCLIPALNMLWFVSTATFTNEIKSDIQDKRRSRE